MRPTAVCRVSNSNADPNLELHRPATLSRGEAPPETRTRALRRIAMHVGQSYSHHHSVLSKRRLTPQTQQHFTTHTRTLEPDISAYVLFGGLGNFQHDYFRSFPDR